MLSDSVFSFGWVWRFEDIQVFIVKVRKAYSQRGSIHIFRDASDVLLQSPKFFPQPEVVCYSFFSVYFFDCVGLIVSCYFPIVLHGLKKLLLIDRSAGKLYVRLNEVYFGYILILFPSRVREIVQVSNFFLKRLGLIEEVENLQGDALQDYQSFFKSYSQNLQILAFNFHVS